VQLEYAGDVALLAVTPAFAVDLSRFSSARAWATLARSENRYKPEETARVPAPSNSTPKVLKPRPSGHAEAVYGQPLRRRPGRSARILKYKLKKTQHPPHCIDGCLTMAQADRLGDLDGWAP